MIFLKLYLVGALMTLINIIADIRICKEHNPDLIKKLKQYKFPVLLITVVCLTYPVYWYDILTRKK